MDPVTHGLIGASLPLSLERNRERMGAAALLGAAGAMLPDLDVLLGSASDPLLTLELHRQFTHALLFIPVGALAACGLLWWWLRGRLPFLEAFLYALLGAATAGVADALTSYGVQLFWPFSTVRVNWNLLSVFDPLLSAGILAGAAAAWWTGTRKWARAGLLWLACYLLLAIAQRQRAESAASVLLQQRGHRAEQLILKPTIGNQLLWSVRYRHGDRIYADGVRLIPFAEPGLYRGSSADLVDWQEAYKGLQGTTLYRDISRFSSLSEGMLVRHPEQPDLLGDGRYAMLPTSVTPLWGIRIDTTQPHRHAAFVTDRNAGQATRTAFLRMLTGQPLR